MVLRNCQRPQTNPINGSIHVMTVTTAKDGLAQGLFGVETVKAPPRPYP